MRATSRRRVHEGLRETLQSLIGQPGIAPPDIPAAEWEKEGREHGSAENGHHERGDERQQRECRHGDNQEAPDVVAPSIETSDGVESVQRFLNRSFSR
jgi:hypothetical protein